MNEGPVSPPPAEGLADRTKRFFMEIVSEWIGDGTADKLVEQEITAGFQTQQNLTEQMFQLSDMVYR